MIDMNSKKKPQKPHNFFLLLEYTLYRLQEKNPFHSKTVHADASVCTKEALLVYFSVVIYRDRAVMCSFKIFIFIIHNVRYTYLDTSIKIITVIPMTLDQKIFTRFQEEELYPGYIPGSG